MVASRADANGLEGYQMKIITVYEALITCANADDIIASNREGSYVSVDYVHGDAHMVKARARSYDNLMRFLCEDLYFMPSEITEDRVEEGETVTAAGVQLRS